MQYAQAGCASRAFAFHRRCVRRGLSWRTHARMGVQTPLTSTSAQGALGGNRRHRAEAEQSLQDTSIASRPFTDATIAEPGWATFADLAKGAECHFKFTARSPEPQRRNGIHSWHRSVRFRIDDRSGCTHLRGWCLRVAFGRRCTRLLDLKRVEICASARNVVRAEIPSRCHQLTRKIRRSTIPAAIFR